MLIPRGIEAVRPEMPSGSVVYLVGDPIGPEGTPILPDAFSLHLTFIYSRFVKSDTFDGFLDRLGTMSRFPEDKLLFVEYRDGRVFERPDVMDAMRRKFVLRPQAERYQKTWEFGLSAKNATWSVVRPNRFVRGPDSVWISTCSEDCIVKSPNCTISTLAISAISVTTSVSLRDNQSLIQRLEALSADVALRSTMAKSAARDLLWRYKPSLQIALPGIPIQGPPQEPHPYELPYIEQ